MRVYEDVMLTPPCVHAIPLQRIVAESGSDKYEVVCGARFMGTGRHWYHPQWTTGCRPGSRGIGTLLAASLYLSPEPPTYRWRQ